MEVVHPSCCGLDVHKRTVVACRVTPGADGTIEQVTRTFGTMAADLQELGDWLLEAGVTHVAMESTGVYWQPVWNALEDRVTAILANARAIKAVPGRKTDVKDAAWIAELLRHGLIAARCVPERDERELRALTRYRRSLIGQRTSEIQRLDKVLEAANLKLSSITSTTLGVSVRLMLNAMLAGQTDPATLAELAKGRLREKIPQLKRALAGRFAEHERFMVAEVLGHIDSLDATIERLSTEITRRLTAYAEDLEHLDTIPGVGQRVAEDLVAEIGLDMSRFRTAGHLSSWARVCPGNDESAGVRRSGRTGKGNRWLRSILVEAGHAAGRASGTGLHGFFRRLAGRRGIKRAAMATGHKILESAYYILRDHQPYREPAIGAVQERREQAATRRMVRDLERQGYQIQAPETAAS